MDISRTCSAARQASRLLAEVRTLIAEARRQATAAVNVSLTALHWRIGRRLGQEVLAKERAGYGEQVMESVAKVLTSEYGRGYTKKNLWRMVQFA